MNESTAALGLFQFILVYLPYGFNSLAGINLPYTDTAFLIMFIILLAGTGFIYAAINLVVFKGKKEQTEEDTKKIRNRKLAYQISFSYIAAVISFILLLMNRDGWHSELIPLLIFMIGAIISGLNAAISLERIDFRNMHKTAGVGIVITCVGIGFSYYLLIPLGNHMILLINGVINLILPILLSLRKAKIIDQKKKEPSLKFAWFDKHLDKNSLRNAITTVALFLVTAATSNLFATMNYLSLPEPTYGLHVLMFMIGTGTSAAIFIYISRNSNILPMIVVSFASLITNLVFMQIIPNFNNDPVSLLISGIGLGSGVSILLRVQHMRSQYKVIVDNPGARAIELFYLIFIAALFGLLYNLTVSFEALGADIAGYLPARSIFQGTLLAISFFALLNANSYDKYFKKLDKGEIKERSATMEDFIKSQKLKPKKNQEKSVKNKETDN